MDSLGSKREYGHSRDGAIKTRLSENEYWALELVSHRCGESKAEYARFAILAVVDLIVKNPDPDLHRHDFFY
jgi:hypothetical protein